MPLSPTHTNSFSLTPNGSVGPLKGPREWQLSAYLIDTEARTPYIRHPVNSERQLGGQEESNQLRFAKDEEIVVRKFGFQLPLCAICSIEWDSDQCGGC
nr:hypothetical protein BgiMline_021296 [Biomphalaria glabrata]